MIKTYLICLLTILGITLSAQDSTKTKLLEWDVLYHHYYASELIEDKTSSALLPKYIVEERKYLASHFHKNWINRGQFYNNSLIPLDQPLIHGAITAGIHTKFSVCKELKINFRLTAEHRGTSYGVFNKKNHLLYAQYWIDYQDTINIFKKILKKDLTISAKIGYLLNERLDEGLMFYNNDAQGYKVKLKYKDWELSQVHYGDWVNSIGLNIEDGLAYVLNKNFKTKNRNASYKVGLSYYYELQPVSGDLSLPYLPRDFKAIEHNVISIHGGFENNKNLSVYAQLGYRPYNHSFDEIVSFDNIYDDYVKVTHHPNFVNRSAFLLGYKYSKSHPKLDFETRTELRYYGGAFNYFRANYDVNFRDNNTWNIYGNTVGDNFMPIAYYERPLNQWAVFTEYFGKNIAGANLLAKGDIALYKKIKLHFDIDFNLIKAERLQFYSYFLYSFALNFKPSKSIDIMAGITNKIFNFDVHYPTFYTLNNPQFLVNLSKNIKS